ncbi:MAG: MMPL family transporter [Acidobacteriota bacterium]
MARFAVRRPWTLIALCSVLPLLLGLTLVRVPIDLSFTGIMNRADPQVALYFDVSREYQLGGSLLVLLEAHLPENELDEVADRLSQRIAAQPEVRSVLPPVPDEWFLDHAPWLVDRETFDAWTGAVRDPADAAAREQLQSSLERLRDEWQSAKVEGARLLQVALLNDPLDEGLAGQSFFRLREVIEAEVPANVTVSFAGMPAVGAEDQARTLGIIRRLTPLSLVLVLLLFRFVERRVLGLLSVALPLLLSVVATLGVIGLVTGRLTVMETFFGVTVFGLGIDFAVHLLVRQREERSRGLGLEEALRANLAGTGRGIVAGGLTTAAAFFVVSLAPDPIALHLGLSGGTGLFFCLFFMVSLLPALWTLQERHHEGDEAKALLVPAKPLNVPYLSHVTAWSVRRPTRCLILGALVLAGALAGLPRLQVETNINKVFNREVPSVETVRRVREMFRLSGAPWLLGTSTVEEAASASSELLVSERFHRTVSVASFVSSDDAEIERRRKTLEEIAPQVDERLGAVALLAGFGGGSAEQLRQGLEPLKTALAVGPPTVDSLPEGLRQRLIAPNGDYLVLAYSKGDTFDSKGARLDRRAAQEVSPRATGISALLEAIMLGDRPWIFWVGLGIAVVVGSILMLDFRDVRLALLALVPVLFGLVVTVGALCWFGVSFNIMTITVAPLIIGLGVDDGIHVVHRIWEDRRVPIDVATAAVGRAIVMTTLTTCSSFGVLLFSDHPGIESMALVMLIGLPVCLAASVTVLPALAQRWL